MTFPSQASRLPVPIASDDSTVPPYTADGLVPFPDSPLAVTRVHIHTNSVWAERDGFCIAHRPTGLQLGSRRWSSEAEAMAVLLKCEPEFPAWPIAGTNEGAKAACKFKFRMAHGGSGEVAL